MAVVRVALPRLRINGMRGEDKNHSLSRVGRNIAEVNKFAGPTNFIGQAVKSPVSSVNIAACMALASQI